MPYNPLDPGGGAAGGGSGTGVTGPTPQQTATSNYNPSNAVGGSFTGSSAAPTSAGKQMGDVSGGNDKGYWVWSGTTWVWNPQGQGGNYSLQDLEYIGGWGNPNGFADQSELNSAKARYMTAMGSNPYGNSFQTNMQYTPFGLANSGSGGSGGAFGGGYGINSQNSEALTPQLEQLRMQRMTQAYPMFGGK